MKLSHAGRAAMRPIVVAALVASHLAGCAAAANYRPIVDAKGVDPMKYEQDLGECQKYAQQVDPAARAVAGALVGALFMGAVGAAIGYHGGDTYRAGAVIGGARGGADGMMTQVEITKRCMAGRGYSVLN